MINHHCIICDVSYEHCNDCNTYNSWRKVACSIECYMTYLAYLDYRDVDHDAAKFAEQIDHIGVNLDKLPPALRKAYEAGREVQIMKQAEIAAENTKANVEVKDQVPVIRTGIKYPRKK